MKKLTIKYLFLLLVLIASCGTPSESNEIEYYVNMGCAFGNIHLVVDSVYADGQKMDFDNMKLLQSKQKTFIFWGRVEDYRLNDSIPEVIQVVDTTVWESGDAGIMIDVAKFVRQDNCGS